MSLLVTDTLYRLVTARRLDDVPLAGDAAPSLTAIRATCGRLLVSRRLQRLAETLDAVARELRGGRE